MPLLPTLADRVWFAYHCLPRDSRGNPPSYVALERLCELPNATLSRLVLGGREDLRGATLKKISTVLKCPLEWLMGEGDNGPCPTGIVPPRPGTVWKCHGELPRWWEVVEPLKKKRKCPAEAFLAAADMPIYRPIDEVTPELALAAAIYAWATSTPAEQRRYADLETERLRAAAKNPGKQKAG